MVRVIRLAMSAGVLAALAGCAAAPPARYLPDDRMPVAGLLAAAHVEMTREPAAQGAPVRTAPAAAESVPFTLPLVLQILSDPWKGLATLEERLFRVAVAPLRQHPAAQLATALEDLLGRPSALQARPAPPASRTPGEHVAYLESVLIEAHRLRERALEELGESDRQFLFEHALFLADNFVPQLSEQNEDQRLRALLNNRFFRLAAGRIDRAALLAAAQAVAGLAEEEWLHTAREAFRALPASSAPVPWVTGTVLLAKQTPVGWIVIGGPGSNTYREGGQRVALLLDLGGDDSYLGLTGATDPAQGISVVIDLDGDDVYEAAPLGLATGRLGIGLLVDASGDDQYRLAPGSGGTGFGGIGLLVDLAGDDRYTGSRFTQGAAIGGMGLLVDRSGNDSYSSFGYAIGLGGPLGVGAVLDLAGNDAYQCGQGIPSAYNETEAPGAKPGDQRFQYDCFGLGAGAGQRLMPKQDPPVVEDAAGGIGLVLDGGGDDRYNSANFSQGLGYYFGLGIKVDARGNDWHGAARYGLGAGAHFGVGLFVDRAGDDHYGSVGPFYDGGAAWDRSVALALDDGTGDDRYDFRRSTGLGIADYRAWSLFLDAGGRDWYQVGEGMGHARHGSLSGFFDLGGEDRYETDMPVRRGGALRREGGGLFVDR
jgi:hypothetical protein